MMLTELVAQSLGALLLAILFSREILQSPGKPRSNLLSLDLPLKLNNDLWPTPVAR